MRPDDRGFQLSEPFPEHSVGGPDVHGRVPRHPEGLRRRGFAGTAPWDAGVVVATHRVQERRFLNRARGGPAVKVKDDFVNGRVLEINQYFNTGNKTTGVTWQACNDPQEHTGIAPTVDAAFNAIIGHRGRLDWASRRTTPATRKTAALSLPRSTTSCA
jgi:hypothetical protein